MWPIFLFSKLQECVVTVLLLTSTPLGRTKKQPPFKRNGFRLFSGKTTGRDKHTDLVYINVCVINDLLGQTHSPDQQRSLFIKLLLFCDILKSDTGYTKTCAKGRPSGSKNCVCVYVYISSVPRGTLVQENCSLSPMLLAKQKATCSEMKVSEKTTIRKENFNLNTKQCCNKKIREQTYFSERRQSITYSQQQDTTYKNECMIVNIMTFHIIRVD